MNKKLAITLGAAALIPLAHADIIDFTGIGLHQVESISSDGGSSWGDFYVGQLNFHDETNAMDYVTYCVDTAHDIHTGNSWNSNVVLSNTLGDANLDRAAALISADFGAANTDDKAAGLQIAVWAAIYDNSGDLNTDITTGVFQARNLSAGVLAAANGYYGDRNGNGIAQYFGYQKNDDGGWSKGQAQMTPVPEPASIAALGIGAVSVLRRRRRA